MAWKESDGDEWLIEPSTDRAGVPIDTTQGMQLFNLPGYVRVALDTVGAAKISTVWLPIPHIGGQWETMIFGGAYDEAQWRWTTEAAAQAGHDQIVAALRDGKELP